MQGPKAKTPNKMYHPKDVHGHRRFYSTQTQKLCLHDPIKFVTWVQVKAVDNK